MKRISALLLLGLLAPLAHAAGDDLDELREIPQKAEWRLIKDDRLHNIKVFVRNEEGHNNIRSFRVTCIADASIETLARVQGDFDNYKRWYFATKEIKFLKRMSDREYIYYMVHDAPIGTPDRDVILRTVIEPMTAKRPYVFMRITALPDYLPPNPPYVRMLAENYTVKWTPLEKNKTLIESEGFINPGGSAPAWAVNFAQGKGPYANMMGMTRQAQLAQYQDANAPLPFTLRE